MEDCSKVCPEVGDFEWNCLEKLEQQMTNKKPPKKANCFEAHDSTLPFAPVNLLYRPGLGELRIWKPCAVNPELLCHF